MSFPLHLLSDCIRSNRFAADLSGVSALVPLTLSENTFFYRKPAPQISPDGRLLVFRYLPPLPAR